MHGGEGRKLNVVVKRKKKIMMMKEKMMKKKMVMMKEVLMMMLKWQEPTEMRFSSQFSHPRFQILEGDQSALLEACVVDPTIHIFVCVLYYIVYRGKHNGGCACMLVCTMPKFDLLPSQECGTKRDSKLGLK